YYGFCSGHWGHYFSPMLEHNGRIVQGDGFVIDDFTNHALQFIEQHRQQPFFVYLPYNTPHSPMQVPDVWWDKFKDKSLTMHHRDPNREDVGHIRAALAMCENIDWNVGRILKRLDELQLANDTIVVYFCDNGPNGSRWNGGMKGRKGSTDEGGVRSRLMIRWPGKIAAGKTVTEIGAAIDLLPTLAGLAGIPVKSDKSLDGIDLTPLLKGKPTPRSDRLIFSHWRGRVSTRSQQFRLDHQGQLFDMHADPGQFQDVTRAHQETALRMKASVAAWKGEVLSKQPDRRPFPVGHAKFKYTQLPARDAKTQGGIQRSNRFPNCSFFTNWTTTKDRITWDVEVLTSGKYHVDVYYTCPVADVGAKVELSFQDSRLGGQVTVGHESPLIGAEQDRVKQGRRPGTASAGAVRTRSNAKSQHVGARQGFQIVSRVLNSALRRETRFPSSTFVARGECRRLATA
ncbi:MAG: sulfatase-like hydrolase/transferase, partial [Planctomycetota bacterium]|nr:sulfatase-like hydrolase/transferase [Planctomycetota bacterium]